MKQTFTIEEKDILSSDDLEPPGCSGIIVKKTMDFPEGKTTRLFREKHYPDIPRKLWHNWKWQLSHRISTVDALSRFLPLAGSSIVAQV